MKARPDTTWEKMFRSAIKTSGLSLREIAKQTRGIDSAQLSRFMRGERSLSLLTAERLAAVIELKLEPKQDGTEKEMVDSLGDGSSEQCGAGLSFHRSARSEQKR